MSDNSLNGVLGRIQVTPLMLLEAAGCGRHGYSSGTFDGGYFRLNVLQTGDRTMVLVRVFTNGRGDEPSAAVDGYQLSLWRQAGGEDVSITEFARGLALLEFDPSEVFKSADSLKLCVWRVS